MNVWGSRKLAEGSWYRLKVGPFQLWLIQVANRWDFACAYGPAPKRPMPASFEQVTEVPADLGFSHVFCPPSSSSDRIELKPALPDRLVVVNLNEPVKVLPDSEVLLYVAVPLWLRGTNAAGGVIFDLPSVKLPATWFGEPSNGRLGYFLSSAHAWKKENLGFSPHTMICPIRVRNTHYQIYSPTRLAIPAELLSIWWVKTPGGETFWTNEARADYMGEERLELDVSGGRPEWAAGEAVSGPRAAGETIIRRSLFLWKRFTNY